MNEERLQQLLISFAENRINRAEYDELMELIRQTPQNDALYEAMDSVWKKTSYNNPANQPQTKNVYDRIINDPRFETPAAEVIHIRRNLFKKSWIKIAASLLLVSAAGIAGYRLLCSLKIDTDVAYLQYVVPAGHRAQFQFPDGTVVAVNSGSVLKYPADFTGKTREIFLQGEAYFDVAHDAARPFIVHTGSVKTQVLGTAFDIEAYGNKKLSVTVTRGKVSVLEGHTKLGVLIPNRQLAYNYQDKKAEEFTVNANDAIGWKEGNLIFHNQSIQEAAETLERWYGVKINVDAVKANQTRFSASFLKKESLNKVLNVLSQLNAFHYTTEADGAIKIFN